MPDPETPETPPVETPGQEPAVTPPETPPESPTLPVAEPPPETPPAEPPPEMTPEEKRDHDMRSWIGRRDAEIRTEMDRRDQALLAAIQEGRAIPETPPTETPDPSVDADAWLEHKLQQKVTTAQQFNEKLIRTGAAILQQDEMVKADPKLADEIYQEIQSGRVPIMRTLTPEAAADIAIAKAKSNILTKRATIKPNPLAGNTPVTTPVGGITPPAAPAAPAVKVPKMSSLATAAAKRWGMTDEEVAKALKD